MICAALLWLAACGGSADPDTQTPTTAAATASTESTSPDTAAPSTTAADVADSTPYVLRSTPIKLPDGRTTWTPLAVEDEVWAAVPNGGSEETFSELAEMLGGRFGAAMTLPRISTRCPRNLCGEACS